MLVFLPDVCNMHDTPQAWILRKRLFSTLLVLVIPGWELPRWLESLCLEADLFNRLLWYEWLSWGEWKWPLKNPFRFQCEIWAGRIGIKDLVQSRGDCFQKLIKPNFSGYRDFRSLNIRILDDVWSPVSRKRDLLKFL